MSAPTGRRLTPSLRSCARQNAPKFTARRRPETSQLAGSAEAPEGPRPRRRVCFAQRRCSAPVPPIALVVGGSEHRLASALSGRQPRNRRFAYPELQSTSQKRPTPVDELIKLAVSNVYLRSSHSDLNSAIMSPNDTGFYCYRAIESLMQEFKTESRKAWPRFRDALQVTQAWIKPLTDNSTSNRHGELKGLSGQERVFLMQRSWTLVYRFACLRLRGVTALSLSEFPLLDNWLNDLP